MFLEIGRKSISTERTFAPQKCVGTMLLVIKELCQELIDSIAESTKIKGARVATLKIKFATFDVITRCQTVDYVINSIENFYPIMERLFRKEMKANLAVNLKTLKKIKNFIFLKIRLLGVRLSRLIRKDDESTTKIYNSGGQQKTLMNFVRRRNELKENIKNSTNREIELVELDSNTSEDSDSSYSTSSKKIKEDDISVEKSGYKKDFLKSMCN